ncbi:MAG: cysteine--tRNA ligase [Alphaproteobacteria bacterium]|jgi:cysteinyl-tRNA synthetase|nr:cysteine--tRNA ligase [Alphaproteobacteria bacterium]
MTLMLHNSLTREKQPFVPMDAARVTLYVCGPTVYNYAHIGNYRPAVAFDVLFRLLRRIYGADHVVYARNITDIEDKIITRALEEGVAIEAITGTYADAYHDDLTALNVLAPTIEPWATGHLADMVAMISALIERGHAYVTQSGVWFETASMADYGKLSGRRLDDNEAGARVEVREEKRNASDFALWKFAKPDEPEDAVFESPWGRGRPGWHIECSAMAQKHLGETIDIHGGGIDLQFPHHENEIAQSECAHGAPLANYWLHNGFLDMAGEKMSKSLGNVVLLKDLRETWPGEVIRFALLSGHYRAPLDWTEDLLSQAKTTLDRLYGALRRVWAEEGAEPRETGVFEALEDDLNTPKALAELARLASEANTAADRQDIEAMAEARANLIDAGALLGLLQSEPSAWEQRGNADENARIDALVKARETARANRDFAEADRIRDQLAGEGIDIMDGPGGSTWRRV